MAKKRSFFERLAGGISMDEEGPERELTIKKDDDDEQWVGNEEEETEDGQLAGDVFQTPDEILIQAMIAGVRREYLNVSITGDMGTLRGRGSEINAAWEENYFYKE